MSNIYTSAEQLIGKTPLMELTHLEEKYQLKAKLLAKLEGFNPAGSVKDRVALAMIHDAEEIRLRYHRTHFWQHRHWSGVSGRHSGLSGHHRHA